MPTIEENLAGWSGYEWKESGDEWSRAWGGSSYLWWCTIFPRIHPFLPAASVLELAPGFGRCTHFLKNFSGHLTLVDLVPRCIERCRERFAADTHLEFHLNDGRSLGMIADSSIDFIFS